MTLDVQTAKQHRKLCSASLVFREAQTLPVMITITHAPEGPKSKTSNEMLVRI